MKKISLLLATLCGIALIHSCSKKPDSTPAAGMSYIINGISDQNVNQYRDTTIYLPLGISFVSGPQERVTITTSGLPSNCSITPANFSGTPSFATICTLKVLPLTSGNIPLNIVGTTASGATKTFTLNLVSAANPNCADMYLDTFYSTDTIYNYPAMTVYSAYSSTTVPGRYTTTKLYISADKVNIDCANNNITTDTRSDVDAIYDAGTGTRSTNTIDYSYRLHVTDGSGLELLDRKHFTSK